MDGAFVVIWRRDRTCFITTLEMTDVIKTLKCRKVYGLPQLFSGRICSAKQENQVRSLVQKDPLEEVGRLPTHDSCPENPTDRGSWWAAVHGLQ